MVASLAPTRCRQLTNCSAQQTLGLDSECLRYPLQGGQAGPMCATLEPADVAALHASGLGQVRLRPVPLLACLLDQAAAVCANRLDHAHLRSCASADTLARLAIGASAARSDLLATQASNQAAAVVALLSVLPALAGAGSVRAIALREAQGVGITFAARDIHSGIAICVDANREPLVAVGDVELRSVIHILIMRPGTSKD